MIINWTTLSYLEYNAGSPLFCWTSLDDNAVQLSDITQCREILIHDFREILKYDSLIYRTHSPGMDSLLGLMAISPFYKSCTNEEYTNRKNEIDLRIDSSIKVLNMMEEYNGWRKSEVLDVSEEEALYRRKAMGHVFIMSKNWLTSPALISLYSLIIRLGVLKSTIADCQSLPAFQNIVESVYDIKITSTRLDHKSVVAEDMDNLVYICPFLKAIFDNYANLFNKKDVLSNFDVQSSHQHYGIVRYVSDNYDNLILLTQKGD